MLLLQTPYMADDITVIYEKVLLEMDAHLQVLLAPPSSPLVAQLHSLREALLMARNSRDIIYASTLLQKVGWLEGIM